MSETAEPNNTNETPPAPKKKRKLLLIIVLFVILLAGGGGGYYFWSQSAVAEGEETAENSGEEEKAEKEEKPKAKKSKAKKAVEEDEDEEDGKKTIFGHALPEDEDVKEVVELPPFIVNLADTDTPRYLRMTVSLGIGDGEGHSGKPDPLFLTRVKNAMLAVLTNKSSTDILTPEGKSKLRKQLLKAAKAASDEPHVEAVYITDFVIQL